MVRVIHPVIGEHRTRRIVPSVASGASLGYPLIDGWKEL
jgi:hypothetical protein